MKVNVPMCGVWLGGYGNNLISFMGTKFHTWGKVWDDIPKLQHLAWHGCDSVTEAGLSEKFIIGNKLMKQKLKWISDQPCGSKASVISSCNQDLLSAKESRETCSGGTRRGGKSRGKKPSGETVVHTDMLMSHWERQVWGSQGRWARGQVAWLPAQVPSTLSCPTSDQTTWHPKKPDNQKNRKPQWTVVQGQNQLSEIHFKGFQFPTNVAEYKMMT